MEVPTVSAKDVRSSLSKKSPMPKKSLRKSLLSPYETIRPICSDTTEIEEIMQRHLVHFKRERVSIPWAELKLLSKEERKKLKEEKKMKHAEIGDAEKSLRKQLVFGMNGVMSSIEKHSLSSAVISEDFVPSFLMNFVLDLATIHHVPILILPELRKLTKEIMGFPSSCFGIKHDGANADSFFYPLHQKIVEKAKEFEVPEHKILCQCPMESVESDDQQPLISEEKDSDSASKAKSGWPCMELKGKSYWKLKKEKMAKGKRVKKGENQAGKESGMDTSSASSDETMEFGESKESSKTLLVKACKRKSSAVTINRKRRASHPYLRTFSLTGLKKWKSLHDPPGSAIASTSGEHSKKKQKSDTDGDGEGFKYVLRNPMDKKHKKVDHFKPLRLTDD
ncbi:uncharacterized protein LOC124171462 isoform X2 [Ischnura elegans]|uniref:uncharacterized protein LOC124171462 isoform X2 n=1 Tax=Ischnura elegans TaxID=197161 RepID=UPI001ED8A1CE|nr:uncharacterized protein LOC124171462 isoform X2 [Ischnura elegans]